MLFTWYSMSGAHGTLPYCGLKYVLPNLNTKVLTLLSLNVSAPGGRVFKGVIGWTLPFVTGVLIKTKSGYRSTQRDGYVRVQMQ